MPNWWSSTIGVTRLKPSVTMDLFVNDPTANLLPHDGTVNYHGRIFSPDWRHSLPKSKRIKTPRINLTFRTMALS